MKTTIILLFLSGVLFADVLKVGNIFPLNRFYDQFEKKLAITPQTKEIIISFTKENSKEVKAFLATHKGYLKKRQAVYLADVTSAPSLAISLFVKPELKKYDFSVGLMEDDEIGEILPKVEGKTTVIGLDKMLIKSIKFVVGL